MPTPCLGRDASKKVCALPTNSHRSTRLELVHPIPHSRINNETMTSLKLACKQISPTMNYFSQGILQLFDHPCTKGWERYTTTDRCEIWGYLATEWPRSNRFAPWPKDSKPIWWERSLAKAWCMTKCHETGQFLANLVYFSRSLRKKRPFHVRNLMFMSDGSHIIANWKIIPRLSSL